MAKSLEESLEKGIVIIKFQSLKSRNIHEREYTLNTKYMNNPTHIIKQSGDKILCYDVEFQKWEDIDKETIIEWRAI
mgnify:FL=1|jgi:hypothetical protein|tara:strand:- start:209 stop:439 length:231 start_codon:yes stop_codon:yes gene_type:complete